LSGCDASAIQFRDVQTPLLDQLRSLTVPPFGAGKHPFSMGPLLL